MRTRRVARIIGVAAVMVGAGLVIAPVLPPLVGAGADTAISRIAGDDRYGTAAAMAKARFPNGVDTVVLASGTTFADALAGAYFAGLDSSACPQQSAILLTAPGQLSSATRQALTDLKVKTVGILGGTAAVSDAVAKEVAGMTSTSAQGGSIAVERVAGANRYDTMYKLNSGCGPASVGSVGGKKTAFVASGANFPDALAAAGASYGDHLPMILTPPEQLGGEARQALTDLKIEQVLIMGGAGAVKPAVNSAIQQMGIAILQQFAGTNRIDTAAQFASYAVANLGFSNASVALARGSDFADALAGAQYTAPVNAGAAGVQAAQASPSGKPTLLTQDPLSLGVETGQKLQDWTAQVSGIVALGGTKSVSTSVQLTGKAIVDGLDATKVTPDVVTNDGQLHTITLEGTFPALPSGAAYYLQYQPSAKNPNVSNQVCNGGLKQVTAQTATSLRADIDFRDCTTPGPHDVGAMVWATADGGGPANVTTFGVAAVTDALQVNPWIREIQPTFLPADGRQYGLRIIGRSFARGAGVFASPGVNNNSQATNCGSSQNELAASVVSVSSPSAIDANFTFETGCPLGKWDVLVDVRNSLAACLDCLTIRSDAPPPAGLRTMTITPSQPKLGQSLKVDYSGGQGPTGGQRIIAQGNFTYTCSPTPTGFSGSCTISLPSQDSGNDWTIEWEFSGDPRSQPCDTSTSASFRPATGSKPAACVMHVPKPT